MLQEKLHVLNPNDLQEKGQFLSRILNSKSYPANSFTYPQNGSDEIEKSPALLILDLNFSEASILRILQKVRENNPSLPIFICSNSVTHQFKNQAIQLGAFVFFPKNDMVRRPPVWVEQISDQNELPRRKRTRYPNGIYFYSPQAAGN